MPAKSVLVRIEGKVQGVWYRGWTEEQANILGLNGWVMNMPDGSVEALFSGEDFIVDDMLVRCHTGPGFAQVSMVKICDTEMPVEAGFKVKR